MISTMISTSTRGTSARRRLIAIALALTTAVGLTVAAAGSAGGAAPQAALVDRTGLVNPFIGTENFGNTFPGASAPFGMVQVSPDTGGQGGYDYHGTSIHGFSQTHLSGVGCGVVGELPIMPTTGAVTTGDYATYASPFSHADETSTPGYYRVGLAKYGINAEMTATDRTGWQRYTFPTGTAHNVLFNTGQANMPVLDSDIRVIGDHTLEGKVHDGGFCAGHDQHTVYFTAEFDKPFSSYGTWAGSTLSSGARDAANGSGNKGAWVSFGSSAAQVTLKVGLSYTGLGGARANLRAETGSGYDFDATRAALKARWNKQLSLATVAGGTHDRQVAYYTSLYHSMLHPNLAGDVDGSYNGFDNKIHRATDYTPRQNFSLWDTYRTQNQLLELLAPRVARDDALSLLAIGREGGWLPRWALANSETNIMTGDPVTPTLVELWSKGFLAGHEDEAYALLKKNATAPAPADSQYNGRAGVAQYDKLGYIPYGLTLGTDCPDHGGDNDCTHPASATLEYSAADAALSTMAAGLGHRSDAKQFAARGQWYRNLWDQRTKQFRPRLADGEFLSPYDPISGDNAFHESGAYQYTWLVPQDPTGLVSLLGGRAASEKRLDDFFAYPQPDCGPGRDRAHRLGELPVRLLRQDHLQPEQRAGPAGAVHVSVDGRAGQDGHRHPGGVHAVHHRPRRHDRQRRPRRDVLLVRHELAGHLPDDERLERLRAQHPAISLDHGDHRALRRDAGWNPAHLRPGGQRLGPLHHRRQGRRPFHPAQLGAMERDPARRLAGLHGVGDAGELGDENPGRAAIPARSGRPADHAVGIGVLGGCTDRHAHGSTDQLGRCPVAAPSADHPAGERAGRLDRPPGVEDLRRPLGRPADRCRHPGHDPHPRGHRCG